MQLNSPTPSSSKTEDVTGSFPPSEFYTWGSYRCAYELYPSEYSTHDSSIPLVLLHPIGVGLSRCFWHRFCGEWRQKGYNNPIYNPDLLGCGESDMPRAAYTPADWAEQLQYFLQTVVKKPVVLLVQGAELTLALALLQQYESNYIKGLVLAGPPAWAVMTEESPTWQQKLAWNLLDSPLGSAFYRYARRRQFLRSFSERQLFADRSDVDAQWLDTLLDGAVNPASRYAVFSFLAGFWRQNYEEAIASISQPTLVVVGEKATSISRQGQAETPEQRVAQYLKHLPQGQARQISGRNVLPYESTAEFVAVVAEFMNLLKESPF
ncbi:MAG TPA: alpha/beta hydrolase [Candidatus Sericytochromatia bacterium]|jgi:pimeloyl-ACP methyl ester carboxylesterase